MLGNFSFGDYFKDETIAFAWEFVTEVLQLEPEKIWVTVHPTDDESRRIWEQDIGLPKDRVIDLEENFWTMGDTGPCGPCTELFYDHGPEVWGGPPGSPEEDGDRYIEFWNLVFPQFDRAADGTLTPLPQPGVDTGMGLERVTAIMQGVHSNYEIDLFNGVMMAAGSKAGINDPAEVMANASVRVIADHIRSSAFLIADGVVPGSEDRAYVLRRIIRRALRHGHKLGIKGAFFHELVADLANEMGDAYPVLHERGEFIAATLATEEARFNETLSQGMELLRDRIQGLQGKTIPGEVVFQLYDTYGFPADLTADVARERGLEVDMAGFETAMEAQRDRGRAAASFTASLGQTLQTTGEVEFLGYDGTSNSGKTLEIFDATGEPVSALQAGQEGIVVLDRTPFYAESGGQVGDTGILRAGDTRFEVSDTLVTGEQSMHVGTLVSGKLTSGAEVEASVDIERRSDIMRNHSATHLMHAALREVLGPHVTQKGSLVNDEKLRFDFSHDQPVSADELKDIERRVNNQIMANTVVSTDLMDQEQAIANGAMALFGEKYDDVVRVLTMGDGFSVELCGGTHVARTGDIGLFKIIAETGIAAGVRRIEALTGRGAQGYLEDAENLLDALARELKAGRGDLLDKAQTLVADIRSLGKALQTAQAKLAASQGSDIAGGAEEIGGVTFLAARVDGDNKAMMQTLDDLRSKFADAIVVLAQTQGDKVGMVVGVSKSVVDRVAAPDIMAVAAPEVGAKGGGRGDLARAGGGDNPGGVDSAFAKARELAAERLA